VSAAPSLDSSGQAVPAPPVLGADEAQALFERHSAAIYGYCFSRLGGREDAEDAVQTTFLNAFGALRRGVVPEYESAWLHKIAENVCCGRHRSAGRRLEVVHDPMTIADGAPAAERHHDELFGLDEALERMAPRQRHALLLREWKGLSYREIGQELRLSPAAVETLLFRARRSLARNLQVGSLIPWLKSLLSGSAAIKAAAAAGVVVAGVSLGGDVPVQRNAARPAAAVRATVVSTASRDRARPPGPTLGSPAKLTRAQEGTAPGQVEGRTGPAERAARPTQSPRTDPVASTPGGEAQPPEKRRAPSPSMPTPPSQPGPAPSPPPVSLPVQTPPPPTLPELPPLPSLPSLPPTPALPSLPPPPTVPRAPELPAVAETPELPQLPEVP
jgi:RNA polymerase sigma factor (sigma-70 family)